MVVQLSCLVNGKKYKLETIKACDLWCYTIVLCFLSKHDKNKHFKPIFDLHARAVSK